MVKIQNQTLIQPLTKHQRLLINQLRLLLIHFHLKRSLILFYIKNYVSFSDGYVSLFTHILGYVVGENNTTVYKNMNNFFTSHANDANLSLNHTDRQLMKSQLTLQAALNSLRLLHTNSVAIKNKLRNIVVDDNYLDNLVITKN